MARAGLSVLHPDIDLGNLDEIESGFGQTCPDIRLGMQEALVRADDVASPVRRREGF
jgi:hypothetical protein